MPIRRLDPLTIDRIAAREVIERPAAAIKELVENALDAGAKTIAVAIKAGGRRLIRAVDGWRGMDAADLVLSVERHATSKFPTAALDRDHDLRLPRQAAALDRLGVAAHKFVLHNVRHNSQPFGLAGYRATLERDFAEIPDLYFNIELIVCEPPYVASRLRFDCSPKGLFLGLVVNGKRVVFAENVFYQFWSGKIWEVMTEIVWRSRSHFLSRMSFLQRILASKVRARPVRLRSNESENFGTDWEQRRGQMGALLPESSRHRHGL